jgi:predicted ribosomally synthesized peptide with SipW-like signal peptide
MRKHKSLILAMAVILAIATVASASTFAWFTASDTVTNRLANKQYGNDSVKIFEVFDPDTPLEPGVRVRKDVGAINTGETPAVVRISFAEVLEKINDAAGQYPSMKSAKWTDAGLAATPKNIPALFNGAVYEGDPDWVTLTAANFATYFTGAAPAFPTDIVIKFKETSVTESTGMVRKYYNFVYYTTALTSAEAEFNGKYQRVQPTGWAFNNSARTLAWTGWEYVTFNMQVTNVKWGALDHPTVEPEAAFPQNQPLNADFVGTPLSTASRLDLTNKYIQLFFSAYVKTDLSACDYGDWWYNQGDGYFYYIGLLAPGQTTNMMLSSVYMSPAASNVEGNDYSGLHYDLIVKMNAIQAVDLALSSSSGWNMAAADAAALVARFASATVGTPLAAGTP